MITGSEKRTPNYPVDGIFVDRWSPRAMAASGCPGRIEELPESLQARETPNGRRALTQSVCEGLFSL